MDMSSRKVGQQIHYPKYCTYIKRSKKLQPWQSDGTESELTSGYCKTLLNQRMKKSPTVQ